MSYPHHSRQDGHGREHPRHQPELGYMGGAFDDTEDGHIQQELSSYAGSERPDIPRYDPAIPAARHDLHAFNHDSSSGWSSIHDRNSSTVYDPSTLATSHMSNVAPGYSNDPFYLSCLFFTTCGESFDEFKDWEAHLMNHIHPNDPSMASMPKHWKCRNCMEPDITGSGPGSIWRRKLIHIEEHLWNRDSIIDLDENTDWLRWYQSMCLLSKEYCDELWPYQVGMPGSYQRPRSQSNLPSKNIQDKLTRSKRSRFKEAISRRSQRTSESDQTMDPAVYPMDEPPSRPSRGQVHRLASAISDPSSETSQTRELRGHPPQDSFRRLQRSQTDRPQHYSRPDLQTNNPRARERDQDIPQHEYYNTNKGHGTYGDETAYGTGYSFVQPDHQNRAAQPLDHHRRSTVVNHGLPHDQGSSIGLDQNYAARRVRSRDDQLGYEAASQGYLPQRSFPGQVAMPSANYEFPEHDGPYGSPDEMHYGASYDYSTASEGTHPGYSQYGSHGYGP